MGFVDFSDNVLVKFLQNTLHTKTPYVTIFYVIRRDRENLVLRAVAVKWRCCSWLFKSDHEQPRVTVPMWDSGPEVHQSLSDQWTSRPLNLHLPAPAQTLVELLLFLLSHITPNFYTHFRIFDFRKLHIVTFALCNFPIENRNFVTSFAPLLTDRL